MRRSRRFSPHIRLVHLFLTRVLCDLLLTISQIYSEVLLVQLRIDVESEESL